MVRSILEISSPAISFTQSYSGNIVVIKTYSGHADVVASALDTLALDEVIGTIAGGDNCVFACLREGYTGDQFIASLKKRIPDVEE